MWRKAQKKSWQTTGSLQKVAWIARCYALAGQISYVVIVIEFHHYQICHHYETWIPVLLNRTVLFVEWTRWLAPDSWETGKAVLLASRILLGHGHLRLVGRFDSLRAFLPPPPLFLSAAFLLPVELLFFLPFFTTSHFPTEPLFEAISAFQNSVSVAARVFCDFLRLQRNLPLALAVVTFYDCRGRCWIFLARYVKRDRTSLRKQAAWP